MAINAKEGNDSGPWQSIVITGNQWHSPGGNQSYSLEINGTHLEASPSQYQTRLGLVATVGSMSVQ